MQPNSFPPFFDLRLLGGNELLWAKNEFGGTLLRADFSLSPHAVSNDRNPRECLRDGQPSFFYLRQRLALFCFCPPVLSQTFFQKVDVPVRGVPTPVHTPLPPVRSRPSQTIRRRRSTCFSVSSPDPLPPTVCGESGRRRLFCRLILSDHFFPSLFPLSWRGNSHRRAPQRILTPLFFFDPPPPSE